MNRGKIGGVFVEKKKIIWFVSIVVAIIIAFGFRLLFLPQKIVSNKDYIVGVEVKYENSEIVVNQNDIIKILSEYRAVISLTDNFPYENEEIEFEINFVRNNKPIHILLGEFNIWYESASCMTYKILDAQQLKNELKDKINMK